MKINYGSIFIFIDPLYLGPLRMDPFNEYAIKFYNELLCEGDSRFLNYSDNDQRKWFLLACDMILKEKNLSPSIYTKTIQSLSSNIKGELNESDWIFVIDCTRKAIKRLHGQVNSDIMKLLSLIGDNLIKLKCTNHVLKLIITCKYYKIDIYWSSMYLEALYSEFKKPIDVLDLDEFNFIITKSSKLSGFNNGQQCERLLILLNPSRLTRSKEYLFNLFSISDSQLIQFMQLIFKENEDFFFEFYCFIICKELMSVDFIIDQLLTDSIDILELLLAVFGTAARKLKKREKGHFKNFHTLLLLKLQICTSEFPFNCEILIKKLELFINKI